MPPLTRGEIGLELSINANVAKLSDKQGRDMIDQLVNVYKEYGFRCEKKYLDRGVLVFTLNNGYFNNAEIVSLEDNDHSAEVFEYYTAAGYACTSRRASTAVGVEAALFKGFFFVDSTKDRLKSDYQKFTKSITSFYSSSATYRYIDAPYQLDGKLGVQPIANEVLAKLSNPKPALFLIEAAAGFGKTCTAYELVNEILSTQDKLPLFSELSRNRAAKIFRYVLLDEIDRTFPQLKSRLVESEISKGRVIVVLDGFDELLRKGEAGDDFESAEPMLETIGELLKGSAKVILTTRRTVIFEGDEFHRWMDQNVDNFDVMQFRLSEPRISDWLPSDRRAVLEDAGFNINAIANPVLLSYLRCIPTVEFKSAVEDKDGLVSKYFNYMLERERIRQDLRLDVEGQHLVLTGIAKDMIDFGYTSESREYIVDLIKTNFVKLLDDVRGRYAVSEKPSRDEVANKLASHALLDKSTSDESKIGFINEFVFGSYVADNIISDSSWMNDDVRFIEPAVLSYIPRGDEVRARLKEALAGVMEFLDWSDRIDFSFKLSGNIGFELSSGEADGLSLSGVIVGEYPVDSFQFNDCEFNNCKFVKGEFSNVTFLNCKFYDCYVDDGIPRSGTVHVLGCLGDSSFIEDLGWTGSKVGGEVGLRPSEKDVDRYILEKFWPVGSMNFHRRRAIKGICARSNEFSPHELYDGIDGLKRRGLIFEPGKPSFVEISLEHLGEIRNILGRSSP